MSESSEQPSVLRGTLCEGRVATITLNRPQRKNALGPEEWQSLAQALHDIARDPQIRAVLLRGSGGAFSAGGDLSSMPERLQWSLSVRTGQLVRDAQVIRQIVELDRPVVAAIEGPCMGAGLALALACDLRIAASTAKLGAVFHRVGLSADFGISWLLPRIVGPTRAAELLLCADVLSADAAQQWGLVNRVVPADSLAAHSEDLCRRLADGPPLAMAASKRSLQRALFADLQSQIEWEAQTQAALGKSHDVHEGIAAFFAKRAAQFSGR
jgi:2-(1,2-epoxy-1,2-dihydrophenyl)acetyl-CoA isomerase